jgi:hypothetical protein
MRKLKAVKDNKRMGHCEGVHDIQRVSLFAVVDFTYKLAAPIVPQRYEQYGKLFPSLLLTFKKLI